MPLSESMMTKLGRAKVHSDELDRLMQDWVPTQTRTMHLASDDYLEHTLRVIVDIPPRIVWWSAVVGDAIHNLRSALDIWMWELVVSKNENVAPTDKNIYFPTCMTGRAFRNWKQDTGKYLPEPLIDYLRSIQPYVDSANNVWIKLLHELDIMDKHKQLLDVKMSTSGADNINVDIAEKGTQISGNVWNLDATAGGDLATFCFNKRPNSVDMAGTVDWHMWVEMDGNPIGLLGIIRRLVEGVGHIMMTADHVMDCVAAGEIDELTTVSYRSVSAADHARVASMPGARPT